MYASNLTYRKFNVLTSIMKTNMLIVYVQDYGAHISKGLDAKFSALVRSIASFQNAVSAAISLLPASVFAPSGNAVAELVTVEKEFESPHP